MPGVVWKIKRSRKSITMMKGITEIILREVEPGNEAARHLFEKAGFTSCGENTYRKDL